jgi:hypothetical protein
MTGGEHRHHRFQASAPGQAASGSARESHIDGLAWGTMTTRTGFSGNTCRTSTLLSLTRWAAQEATASSSQIRTVPSKPPVMMWLPSGVTPTAYTGPSWPVRVCSKGPWAGASPGVSGMSQTREVLAAPPAPWPCRSQVFQEVAPQVGVGYRPLPVVPVLAGRGGVVVQEPAVRRGEPVGVQAADHHVVVRVVGGLLPLTEPACQPGRRRVRRTARPPKAADASVRIPASVHWKRQNLDGGW